MTSRLSIRFAFSLISLVVTPAKAEPSIASPQEFHGYYVYASDINDGSRCKKGEPTPTEELERTPQNGEDIVGYQMTITASEIRYDGVGTHVSCNIQRVYRPENKNRRTSSQIKYVGTWLRPFDPVYALNLRCFDEGETSRGNVMVRLVRLGSATILLETEKSLVTNAWAKCRGQ
jgi:hypothetical protein